MSNFSGLPGGSIITPQGMIITPSEEKKKDDKKKKRRAKKKVVKKGIFKKWPLTQRETNFGLVIFSIPIGYIMSYVYAGLFYGTYLLTNETLNHINGVIKNWPQ